MQNRKRVFNSIGELSQDLKSDLIKTPQASKLYVKMEKSSCQRGVQARDDFYTAEINMSSLMLSGEAIM